MEKENKTHVSSKIFLASMAVSLSLMMILFQQIMTVKAQLDVYTGETLRTFGAIQERLGVVETDVKWIRRLFESGGAEVEQ